MNELFETTLEQAEEIGRLKERIQIKEIEWEQAQLDMARLQQENMKLKIDYEVAK